VRYTVEEIYPILGYPVNEDAYLMMSLLERVIGCPREQILRYMLADYDQGQLEAALSQWADDGGVHSSKGGSFRA
jgi:hypothetical protein